MARDMLLHNLTWKISKKFFRRKGQDECYRFCSEAKILNGPSELFGKRQVFSTLKKCLRLNLTRKIWNHTKTDSLRMTWFRQSFPNFPYSISYPVPQSANKTLSANSNGVIQNVCVCCWTELNIWLTKVWWHRMLHFNKWSISKTIIL